MHLPCLPSTPRSRFRPWLRLGLTALLPGLAFASGTRVGFKDAFATERGNAFVATADNPSAIYYNPAGLIQLDGDRASATEALAHHAESFRADMASQLEELQKKHTFERG